MLRAADEGEHAWDCLRCEAMVLHANRVEVEAAESDSDADLELDDSRKGEDFLTSTSE